MKFKIAGPALTLALMSCSVWALVRTPSSRDGVASTS